ncbi:hypothetical protein DER29_6040 [Micromonospora sp. M71_S20]|uniref:hypothetical protein n=1 Tax=Micromonospora sp. M71_S20 TaxID=592872 RepID=UPI000F1C84C7|nr:hypothetical protein [Micromonospora sp. M71_S20]RLK09535.1 hypothetical protein DER29_6040 [Micromonospora sp. M71_S20]
MLSEQVRGEDSEVAEPDGDADSPDYNLLAQSADDAGADGHFDLGLTAMLDSFTRLTR